MSRYRILPQGREANVMSLATFMDLKKSLEDRFSSGGRVILHVMGKGCGIRSCQRLKQIFQDKAMLLYSVSYLMRGERWGQVRFDIETEDGTGVVRVKRSFEAKEYGGSPDPVCHFLAGYIQGAVSEIFERESMVIENECLAKGDNTCSFKVT